MTAYAPTKPDGALNKAKIGMVNRLLEKCREALEDEYSFAFLDLLDEDDVPQNSDLVLVLSQYEAAMKQLQSTYHGWDGVGHRWALGDSR